MIDWIQVKWAVSEKNYWPIWPFFVLYVLLNT